MTSPAHYEPIETSPLPTSTIAAKFGGTSLADAAQIRKVAAIVRADPRRRYIVVSAPGKRHKDDQKVTDLLLTCWHLAAQRLHYQEPLGLVRERYAQIARELDVAPLDEPVRRIGRRAAQISLRRRINARDPRLDRGARRVFSRPPDRRLFGGHLCACRRVHSLYG
jgi:aspartokinase